MVRTDLSVMTRACTEGPGNSAIFSVGWPWKLSSVRRMDEKKRFDFLGEARLFWSVRPVNP